MNNADSPSLSRATSISRASHKGSTMSRNQSLIKKNVAPQDLKPSDILIERFVAWKAIVKQLIGYFEGVADIENNTARELTKLGAVIQVPFRSGNQFLGEGGLQDIYFGIRDKTRVIADQHANLGRTVESSIVQHLIKLREEIKAHIKNVQNDTGKLASSVARERELSAKLIIELSTHISTFKNTPMSVTHKSDPYVANQLVAKQLAKQVQEENALQKSIIIMQQNSAHFEEGIVRAIQSAWQTFEEWQVRMSGSVQETWRVMGERMAGLASDREWISFAGRSDHLLDPETPLRDPEHINYPSKEDPSVIPVHTGIMERKKRFTRSWRESYFVLTPAGFLHEYTSADPAAPGGMVPIFSLFLPACTLGPAASIRARSHKFHIEGRKDGMGTTKAGGVGEKMKHLVGGGEKAYSFRARSHEDMMEWWNDIRMLCARYLVASEQMERSGPIQAAVRAAGYASSEEEGVSDDEDEEEGSSVEEENDDEGMYEDAPAAEQEGLPEYAKGGSRVEVGANGYAFEKKEAEGGDITRKLSKRQQEKAPEGKPLQGASDEKDAVAGPAPADSKFKEELT